MFSLADPDGIQIYVGKWESGKHFIFRAHKHSIHI